MDKVSFFKLPEEKRALILQVSAEEFIQCGYTGASTNTITRRAGISKGILFHYFGSKKELYLYLLADITERLVEFTAEQTEVIAGASLYDNMAALFLRKAAYFNTYILEMNFMERAGQEQSDDVRQDVRSILTGLAVVMKNKRLDVAEYTVDHSQLRAGITREQALECIMLSLESLDSRFYALYRGRGAEIMANPDIILGTVRLFLDVVCRGLFVDEPRE